MKKTLWLSHEWLAHHGLQAFWPFPETTEEQRLCDAGQPWQHLRAQRPPARSQAVKDARQLELGL